MKRVVWDNLLETARTAHEAHRRVSAFCKFPSDLKRQSVVPKHVPAADLMAADQALETFEYPELRDAFLAAGPEAAWRETYKGTDIGQDFMDRFGCYCLIGQGGAFASTEMWAWVVYMPRKLYYPRHHHPGEELYTVIAGQAEFFSDGDPDEILTPRQSRKHKSNQPHAMQTRDQPVMAYVIWRNGFETGPKLTPQNTRS